MVVISSDFCGPDDFIYNGQRPGEISRHFESWYRQYISYRSLHRRVIWARAHIYRNTHENIYWQTRELPGNGYASCMPQCGDIICILSIICVEMLKRNLCNCFTRSWYFHLVWCIDFSSYDWHLSPDKSLVCLFVCQYLVLFRTPQTRLVIMLYRRLSLCKSTCPYCVFIAARLVSVPHGIFIYKFPMGLLPDT